MENTKRSSSPPPTTKGSSAVFRTPITHCRERTQIIYSNTTHLSSSPLRNLLFAPHTKTNTNNHTTKQINRHAYVRALPHSKYKEFLAKIEVNLVDLFRIFYAQGPSVSQPEGIISRDQPRPPDQRPSSSAPEAASTSYSLNRLRIKERPIPPEEDEVQAERRLQGRRGKARHLSKPVVTNLPSIHDAKVKDEEKTKSTFVSSANNGGIIALPRNTRRSSNTTTSLIFAPAQVSSFAPLTQQKQILNMHEVHLVLFLFVREIVGTILAGRGFCRQRGNEHRRGRLGPDRGPRQGLRLSSERLYAIQGEHREARRNLLIWE